MTAFGSHHDVAQHMREPVEPPELFDHQIAAFQDKVQPWMQSIEATHKDREGVRQQIIDKMRTVVGVEVDVRCYSPHLNDPGPDDPVTYDVVVVRNLETYDPDRQGHEIRNNYLDLPEDRGKDPIVKTDKGLVEALAAGDVEARRRFEQGRS